MQGSGEINIDGRFIGEGHPPFIIAEISANHNGSLDAALALIEEAKRCGADAVKIQTYTADTITLNSDLPEFQITQGPWAGRNLHDLYEEAHTPWEWHEPMFDKARAVGITLFSSPFDTSAVDFLDDLGAPALKIASFEMLDFKLVEYAASKGKPIIISTGMANLSEITMLYEFLQKKKIRDFSILHCVSGYPAEPEEYSLQNIADMRERFNCPIGLSDHTLSNVTAVVGTAMGASIIEKHFTMSRSNGGVDSAFSIEPVELASLCKETKIAWQARGKVNYERKESEKGNVQFRRSLYFVRDLEVGQVICDKDIRSVRPGYGAVPYEYDDFIGCEVVKSVKAPHPANWDCVKKK